MGRLAESIRLLFERRTKGISGEERAFQALLGKFAKVQYLVDQKATVDVIEKAPVGICITNQDYRYEYVNPTYCRIYGYTYDELVGRQFTVVVPEEYRKDLEDLHDKFMNQERELEGEWTVVTKSGEQRTILANAAYVVDAVGRPKKITFVLDITARKRAEAERAAAVAARGELLAALREKVVDPLKTLAERRSEASGRAEGESLSKIGADLERLLREFESTD